MTRNCKKLKVSEQQMKQSNEKTAYRVGENLYQYTYDRELVPKMHKELQNIPK